MDVENFISRWTSREGGAERANYQMFLTELCDVLGVARPDPAGSERQYNDYVFERAVRQREAAGVASSKRIDLYKKNAFILEAKQSRLPGMKNALPGQLSLLDDDAAPIGRRSAARGWDVMMQNARRQAEEYVFLLDPDHAAPPFILVCDVGNCLELYADFTGTGRGYTQFPDRQGFRIYMEDLRKPELRDRLACVWTDPQSLDPAKKSARVTREIAKRLAEVSKALEGDHPAEEVAHFLMRCIFTMFAEDVDLLPKGAFTQLLQECVESPAAFAPLLTELWARMDEPDHDKRFYSAFKTHLRYFNGNLFRNARAFPLAREEIGELLAAAKSVWTEVDPAIFGTLLEQALDKDERRKLGAHYTPRAYVQRLVDITVMEPLRDDWQAALTKAEDAKDRGEEAEAVGIVKRVHHRLCATRVLDPACGTGNFLYVSLESMKKLEGEVLETLAKLGEPESMGLDRETVDPHQFLGLELNPRAAAIAELVVWIGYLQQHYRTRSGHPSEPILRAFDNINFGRREGYDAVLTWDGYPKHEILEKDGKRIENLPRPRRPAWPEAEFIVGNPPFIGNKRMREALGWKYVDALRGTDVEVSPGADFVMHWWNRAAVALSSKQSKLRRFGFVTTNSVTQPFNRRVVEHHTKGQGLFLRMAIPDHPWIKSDRQSAAVRIAMTVVAKGTGPGTLLKIIDQENLDTDEPKLSFSEESGFIAANLEIGAKTIDASPLRSNYDLAHQGVIPVGEGFRIDRKELEHLGLEISNLPPIIKRYMIGRDLMQQPEERYIIDFFGMSDVEARKRYPELFDIILDRVKPQRDTVNREKTRQNYWVFGEPRARMRSALAGLNRYIATCRTAKFRVFSFLTPDVLPDTKIVAIALERGWHLAVLSSKHHALWALRTGGLLESRPTYQHAECFTKFPFPVPTDELKAKLDALGDELDRTRKEVQAAHQDLTITGIYNVLEKVSIKASLTDQDEDVKQRGRVLILKELHDQIDHLTGQAYGWPIDLSSEAILGRLVTLNAQRTQQEASGTTLWLRPEFQIPRVTAATAVRSGQLKLGESIIDFSSGVPTFPSDRAEQPLAVLAALMTFDQPADAAALSRGFKRGGKRIEQRIHQVLATLTRYGRVTALPDGRYVARRVA